MGVVRKPYFIPLILVISFLISGYAGKPEFCLTDPSRPHIAGAETIVNEYLEAVDRGELRSFGRKLERSEIIPVKVEYIYQIATGTIEIKVTSNLKEPLEIQGHTGAVVRSICSVVDDGRIVETESHIWIK